MSLKNKAINLRSCAYCGRLITFIKTKRGKDKPVSVKSDPDLGFIYTSNKRGGFFTHRCLREPRMDPGNTTLADKELARDRVANLYAPLLMECSGDIVKFRKLKRQYNEEIERLRQQNS